MQAAQQHELAERRGNRASPRRIAAPSDITAKPRAANVSTSRVIQPPSGPLASAIGPPPRSAIAS